MGKRAGTQTAGRRAEAERAEQRAREAEDELEEEGNSRIVIYINDNR